jgi:hypothetical protein
MLHALEHFVDLLPLDLYLPRLVHLCRAKLIIRRLRILNSHNLVDIGSGLRCVVDVMISRPVGMSSGIIRGVWVLEEDVLVEEILADPSDVGTESDEEDVELDLELLLKCQHNSHI